MKDLIANSLEEIDIDEMFCPMFAIFVNSLEYPGVCVARLFDLDRPTNVVIVRENVREMNKLFRNTRLMFWPRDPKDPKELVGTWM